MWDPRELGGGLPEETLELPPGGRTGSGEERCAWGRFPGKGRAFATARRSWQVRARKMKLQGLRSPPSPPPPSGSPVKTLGSSPKDTREPCRFRVGDGQGQICALVSSLVPWQDMFSG